VNVQYQEGGNMFQINDSVVYESAGVCIIKDICTQSYIKNKKQKYYVLDPVYKDAGAVTIMIPVDTDKKLRKVISKEDLEELIKAMPEMELPEWEESISQRTQTVRQTMKDSDITELASLMKSYFQRRENLVADGKKLPKVDKDSFEFLEKRFTEEVGFSLGIEPDAVLAYIDEQYKQLT